MEDDDQRIAALGGVGILKIADLPDLSAAAERVRKLMIDNKWHDATAIISASQQREGLRRMRELRTRYIVERQRIPGRRDWVYRLLPVDRQMTLFSTGGQ